MKTRNIILMMAAAVVLALGAAIAVDQARTDRAEEVRELKKQVAAAKFDKTMAEMDVAQADIKKMQAVLGELGRLRAEVDKERARQAVLLNEPNSEERSLRLAEGIARLTELEKGLERAGEALDDE